MTAWFGFLSSFPSSIKISGPLLDRIDIHIDTPAVKIEELQSGGKGESSESIRLRVERCRHFQHNRHSDLGCGGIINANIPQRLMDQVCEIGEPEKLLLRDAMKQLSLSARAYNKILKVSRTIADLDESKKIAKSKIVNSVGAGDAFCAGFIYGIYENWNMKTTLLKAHAAGAAMMKVDASSGKLPNIKKL